VPIYPASNSATELESKIKICVSLWFIPGIWFQIVNRRSMTLTMLWMLCYLAIYLSTCWISNQSNTIRTDTKQQTEISTTTEQVTNINHSYLNGNIILWKIYRFKKCITSKSTSIWRTATGRPTENRKVTYVPSRNTNINYFCNWDKM
jgi:hypothetical protein